MQCRFCLYNNSGDVERCLKCHKRLSGDITVDGIVLSGANALAPRRQRSALDDSGTLNGSTLSGSGVSRRAPRAAFPIAPGQPSLFNGEAASNVIPFETFQRPIASSRGAKPDTGPAAEQLATAKLAIRKLSANSTSSSREIMNDRTHNAGTHNAGTHNGATLNGKALSGKALSAKSKNSSMDDSQGSLEFLPPVPQGPRVLKTTVEARIYCDAPVAAPMHRFVAAALDGTMIAIAVGLFLGIFQCFGGGILVNQFNMLMFAASLILITMFYGLLFAISGRETAGQAWTDLRLINFDGFPPDGVSRCLRFTGCWLSFCSGGIGLVWALLDEENLTWHDHMSKTFVTLRELESTFVRAQHN